MNATKTNATEIGARIGKAIARDVISERMDRAWTGLDAQDGDQLMAAGIEHGTPEWTEAETAAELAYTEAIADRFPAETEVSE